MSDEFVKMGILLVVVGLVVLAIVLLYVPPPGRARLIGGFVAAAVGVPALMFLIPTVGLVVLTADLVWSVVALLRKPPDKRFAVARLIACLCLIVVCGAVVLSARAHYFRLHTSARCAMHMSYLGKAVAMYRAEHEDQYPPSLDVILQDGSLSTNDLVCVSNLPMGSQRMDDEGGSSYFYCAPCHDDDDEVSDEDARLVACDIAPVHPVAMFRFGRCRHILLSNNKVTRFTEAEFQRELQKPQNRQFAEELTKGVKMTPQERLTYIAPSP